MFESPTTIQSSHSPHLRKPGGKAVFSDLGAGEPGNSVQEGYVFPLVLGEMKGANSPLHAAAIMPSPTFLWRFKVILFLIWGFTCCKIGWDSVMRMSADLRDLFLYEAFLYYNPFLLVTMMVWLWGVCLWVFSQSSVNYAKIFDLDQNHLTHREIWKCSIWMTIIVPTSMTAYLYLYSHGEVSLAASQPVILYVAVALVLVFPFDIFYLSSRYFLLRTLWQIALPLQQPISFPDFFLADILTSMAKVFSDLERSVCRMVHRQVATIAWFEADSVCGSHSVGIPLVLVIPYIWRLMQCLRQYKDTKEKATLFNALKYSTAVPVIFLSALKYHVLPDSWTYIYRRLWLFSSVVNSLYSFYWDVTRDWDLSVFTRIFKFNKPSYCSNLLYGRQWVYFWVIGSNLILRCTWTYKLSAHLRHNYLTVFMVTALEMLRRFQWIFFRVENEWNKITKSGFQLPMTDIPREDEKLLGSTNHNV
ncbi:EXS (ERD1/XPR1/SYG1) family protein isoform 2 [Theobroma cacao]|uniref:EXS (ERD1/XPR1/SYG1) family protein isoform 2 n=1 Tax=Theobroma cacao TaxID=3641 RepID=A0A061DUP3_THECC|nr:EXS (ERD1/XPR1/SYG1) family protein isoform 2 [Theobroma cacao]